MSSLPTWLNAELPRVPEVQDLPKWIANIEGVYPVKKGLASAIRFAHKTQTCTDVAFLYLHGYGSSIKEMSPFPEILAQRTQSNIYFQRIARHGISLAPMEYLSPRTWYESALRGLAIANRLGKKVIVVSCSTGSTLSLLLSARHTAAHEMAHQLLFAPNCWPRPAVCRFFPIPIVGSVLEHVPRIPYIGPRVTPEKSLQLQQIFRTPHTLNETYSDLHAHAITLRTPTVAITNMMKLVMLLWNIQKKSPSCFRIPATVYTSTRDKSVVYRKMRKFFSLYQGTHIIHTYEKSTHKHNHVLAGDIYSPETTEDMVTQSMSALAQLIS